MQLRATVMRFSHGLSVAQASPNASRYAALIDSDYVGIIARDDLFRPENLMPVNPSFLRPGVSLLEHLHALDAWIKRQLIVHCTILG